MKYFTLHTGVSGQRRNEFNVRRRLNVPVRWSRASLLDQIITTDR